MLSLSGKSIAAGPFCFDDGDGFSVLSDEDIVGRTGFWHGVIGGSFPDHDLVFEVELGDGLPVVAGQPARTSCSSISCVLVWLSFNAFKQSRQFRQISIEGPLL